MRYISLSLFLCSFSLAQSNWNERNFGADFSGVTWTGSQLVAVGSGGAILTSPDGDKWTERPSNTTKRLSSVIWTGTQLVAIGDEGAILTSPDGVAWAGRHLETKWNLNSITWAGSQLVTIGGVAERGSVFLTSPSGIAWTERGGMGMTPLGSPIWTGDRIVAVGGVGTAGRIDSVCSFYSMNGASWGNGSCLMAATSSRFSVAWTGTQAVVIGGDTVLSEADGSTVMGSFVFTSPDGISSWTKRNILRGASYAITWTGSELAAMGSVGFLSGSPACPVNSSCSGGRAFFTSPDGTVWTKKDPPEQVYPISMAWTGSRLVVVGGGAISVSREEPTGILRSRSQKHSRAIYRFGFHHPYFPGEAGMYNAMGRTLIPR